MDMDPKEFLNVPLNEKRPTPCSPSEPDIAWRGILIRAPRQVRCKKGETVGDYGAFAAIPICAFYMAEVRLGPQEPFRLVAVNTNTRQTYEGPIVELDPYVEPPPPQKPLTQKEIEGMASGGYINPNLADFVKLPQVSATYEVHIELREMKSNVVAIEVVVEEN